MSIMYKCLFLVLVSLVVVNSRPQYNGEDATSVDAYTEAGPKVSIIPFYGGGKGQSLQLVENPDGTVTTTIIKSPQTTTTSTEEAPINLSELEYPPLPSREHLDFGPNIRNIQQTALNIIQLQELAKKNGKLSPTEEATYQSNMDSLSLSAQNLAKIQTDQDEDEFSYEQREGLTDWFERKKIVRKEKERKKEEQKKPVKEEEKRTEKPKEEEEGEEVGENGEDAIEIGLPPEDASVAEAKPVGLAVAGEGGVASSKPIATAVVGPGGLAIARPVGTAIAGVSPDQALVPIYAEGYIGANKPKRYGSSSSKTDSASEYLNKIINKYHQN